jgi:hypothetical protein
MPPPTGGQNVIGPVAIYRKSAVWRIAGVVLLGLSCIGLWFARVYSLKNLLGASIGAGMAFLLFILDGSPTVTITSTEIATRLNPGSLRRALLSEIVELRETWMTNFTLGKPAPVKALRVVLRNGQTLSVAIDFPDRERLVATLREIVKTSDAARRDRK